MQKRSPDIAVYVGPTGIGPDETRTVVDYSRLMILPPVVRGDLLELPDYISTVLIVDGYFGSVPSVSHLELLKTLEHRRVFGCSSLGAIRAYELRYDGMIGLGRVYKTFFDFEDFMDDEVALLHAPGPYYFPFTIPLVNVRFALRSLEEERLSETDLSNKIIHRLKSKYFGERTLESIFDAATQEAGADFCELLRSRLSTFDIKHIDYLEALCRLAADSSDLHV